MSRQELPFSKCVMVNPQVKMLRGHEYPFIEMKDLSPGNRDASPVAEKTFTGSGSRFEHGDTLFARITPCLENGKISKARLNDRSAKGHGSTEFIVLRGLPGVTETSFVYYLSISKTVRSFAESKMTGSSGRQRVPADCLDHLLIPLPPLPEQRAIAGILGALDDKIDLNRRMNETLEAMARALFKSWFVDFDPVRAKMEGRQPFGMDKATADLFPDRLVESEIGLIPEGWEVRPLDKIADYVNGAACQKFKASPGEQSLPVLKIREINQGITAQTDRAKTNISSKHRATDGDVLFSWSGTLICKVWTGGDGFVNQHVFKVTSAEYPRWFFLHWTKHHLEDFKRIAADKATTMGHIKRGDLKLAMAVIPTPELIEMGTYHLGSLTSRLVSNDLQSRTLAELRDLLLPRLLSGEIRVADAEKAMEASL